MRRLRGRLRARKRKTKHRTEERELRSRGSTMISVPGNSPVIRALVSSAAFRLLAGSTSLAPRIASTRAVSAPIPDRRSGAVVVTSSPVDLEPKPLAPVDPIRYTAKSNTIHRWSLTPAPSLRHVMPHSGYGGGLAVGDHIPHFTLTNPSHPVAL
ncbi:hypothetical protein B296_00017904 [Ensete ventricosum]|uniref:Uncharacterized protein n=1 Tax=Ensete ventricosum TaxID=4639 RepID=A0A427AMA0_ENSVE|nr:hypothetical protein B296_00017904 [Ensete ventricosum]